MIKQKRQRLFYLVEKFLLLFQLKERATSARWMCSKKLILPFLLLLSFVGNAQLATETFNSGIPSTWTLFGNGVGSSTWQTSTDGLSGSNAASVNPSADAIGAGNTAQYFLVTPSVAVPAQGEIRFYTKRATTGENANVSYQIRLSTASQPDINGFTVVLQSWDGNNLNTGSDTDYEEKILAIPSSIPAGLNVYIAFVAENTQTGETASGDAWFIDNVRVIEGCSLVEADNITFTGISPISATINWSHATASNFEIQYVAQGELPAATGTAVVGNTHTFNSLTGGTTYDAYIRTTCDASTSSAWAGPFSFTTAPYGMSCNFPIVITASQGSPFSLDANLMDYPNAGSDIYSTHGTNCLSTAITSNHLAGNKIYLSYTPTEDGLIDISQKTLPWTFGTQCWGNAISGVFIYENCAAVGVNCLAGLNTTATNQPKHISNFPVTAGTSYTIVISTSLAGVDASVCFEFDLSFTTCPTPTEFSYTNLEQQSVMLSWNHPATIADSWEYAAVLATDAAPTTAGTSTTTHENVLVDQLTPGTTYHFYVRPICNGIPGEWSAPYAFTTLCSVLDTPYYTGFEGASNTNSEPCWTIIDANADGVQWSYLSGWVDGYLGYASLLTGTNQNFNHDYLVSPQINFDGVQKRLRFSHQVGWGGSSSYSIRISTSGVGLADFTYVLVPETVLSNESWEEVIYNIPEEITGLVNIAWVISPVGSGQMANRVSITNVYIEDKPACPDPIQPTVGTVTQNTAELAWTVGEAETQWEVLILPVNAAEPTADSEGILVGSNPYTAENLDPATRYKYYVRAYCSEEHQSNWIGPVNFTTDCIVFETPFYESFNDEDDTTKKFCWTIVNANQDGAEWVMESTNPEIRGSNSWFNPTTGYDDWLISPAINVQGVKELKYKYRARFSLFHAASRYGLQVLISTTDTNPESFTELVPLEVFTNIDYVENSVIFQGNGTVYIAFRVPPDFDLSGGTSILDLEDVAIIDAPLCPAPTALSTTNILASEASLTWNPAFQETAWEVVVQPAASGVPTAAGVVVTTASMDVDQLTPGTQYEYYVRALCSDDEVSEWVGPFAFTTLCSAYTTPFVETFNFDSTSESCWRVLNTNQDDFHFAMNIISNTFEGDQAAGMFTGTNGANNDWLISPAITVTGNHRLRFQYRVYDSFFTEDLQIKLSTTGIDPASFTTTLFDTEGSTVVINNTEWKEMIINLPEGITGDINIGWHIPTMPASPAGYRGQLLIIDQVIVEDIPTCPAPFNVVVVNTNDTSIELDWETAGSETQWEVVVQPYGTDAPGVTSLPEYTHLANTHPFIVEGLVAAQKYQVYVRAICATTSEWVGPLEINTKCSFDDVCEYKIVFSGGPSGGVDGGFDLMQNGVVVQTLEFPTSAWYEMPEPEEFIVFLCRGAEYSLFWDAIGTAPGQYPGAMIEIFNDLNELVFSADLGEVLPRRTVYTGVALCGAITCPQPTDLTVNAAGELTWTAGGTETTWEVFIQPVGNGTLPLSGTVVTTNSYMPQAADFILGDSGAYEYFVRAICSQDDNSFWSGPSAFAQNDVQTDSVTLTVNPTQECAVSTTASLNGATPSAEAMTCEGVNAGDIWFDFQATSTTHLIEIGNFSGLHYHSSGELTAGKINMVLYKVEADELVEITCSSTNAIATMYTSELEIGATYKLRIAQNEAEVLPFTFEVCVKTIVDPCSFTIINGGFEQPVASFNSFVNMMSHNIIPGWRNRVFGYWEEGVIFYFEALNTVGVSPAEGAQFVQLLSSDTGVPADLNNMDGLYQDIDSSEATQYHFSFAHATRGGDNTIELYAGPPQGPFVLVQESTTSNLNFTTIEGTYDVPAGQGTTRFVFRSKYDAIGNLLDDVVITPNNEMISENQTLACGGGSVAVQAHGVGNWVAAEGNPGEVTISDVNGGDATLSGFSAAGDYVFYWRTRYCEQELTITYLGFDVVPTVTTPVEYCLTATAQPLEATAAQGYSLMWYTEATGGTGSATAPTPSTATLGTTSYYVAHVDANGCEGPRAEITVNIVDLITPEVGFTYDATSYCLIGAAPVITTATGFVTGGSFTANPSTGISINATTGAIDLSASTAGTYLITYTLAQNGCVAGNESSFTIALTEANTPEVGFNYDATSYCEIGEAPVLTTATGFVTGGSFTANPSTGLSINATTGAIDLASSTAGTYVITYALAQNGCNSVQQSSYTLTITPATTAVVGFSYASPICSSAAVNPLPNFVANHTANGVFSSATVTVNPVTGEIDLSTATVGSHAIVYTVTDSTTACIEGDSATFTIVISQEEQRVITQACEGNELMLQVEEVAMATYSWMDQNNNLVGSNQAEFNVSEYLAMNPSASLPLNFTVLITAGGCTSEGHYTVSNIPCIGVPRGISPNGDGKNDSLDLTGMGVQQIIIFNRYGREVYKFSGNYTNQWYGQTNNGEELPTATYFYSLVKQDGSNATGWIYISR